MLGNRRFLIIVISVLSAVALIIVGASARVFTDEVIYSYSGLVTNVGTYGAVGISCYRFEVFDSDDNLIFYYGLGTEAVVYRNWASGGLINVPQFYADLGGDIVPIYSSVDISASATIVFYSSVDASYTNFVKSSFVEPSGVSSLSASVFDIGDALVSFVMSSWVVLVPVVAFVAILGFGIIRRLVKGV